MNLKSGMQRSESSPPLIKWLVFIALAAVLDLLAKPRRLMTVKSSFASSESLNEPLRVHLARAKETGRGREARSPAEIPWRGWLDIIWRTARQASEDRILAIAGGVVFYGLLALFPAITALVSFYGLFATPDSIGSHLSFLQGVMPAEAYSVVQDQVGRVIAKGQAGLTFGFLVGLILALWSANAGVKAVMDALNIVYEENEKRGFIKLNLVSLAFTLAGIFATLIAVGAVVVVPLLLSWLGFGSFAETNLQTCPLAGADGRYAVRAVDPVSIWAEPAGGAVEMDQPGRRRRHIGLVRRVGGAVVLFCQFRELQRDLWIARRRDRHDDMDVDVGDRHPRRG